MTYLAVFVLFSLHLRNKWLSLHYVDIFINKSLHLSDFFIQFNRKSFEFNVFSVTLHRN